MSTTLRHEYFGPYKLIRPLGYAHGAARFVVLCNRTDTNYLLYRFQRINNHKLRRNLFDAFVEMSTLDHPHLLKIKSVSYDDRGQLCIITPYTGNHDGLVLLDDLLEIRDGKLSVAETARAIEHLLDAIASAHKQHIFNGPINPADILVDRYGALQIQFYGLSSLTQGQSSNANDHPHRSDHASKVADEIRSIVNLGYTMLTGLKTRSGRIAPSRVIKKLDRNWDTWFEIGLDPVDGFDTLTQAINALPTKPGCTAWLTGKSSRRPQVHIGSVLRRFRTSSTPGDQALDQSKRK